MFVYKKKMIYYFFQFFKPAVDFWTVSLSVLFWYCEIAVLLLEIIYFVFVSDFIKSCNSMLMQSVWTSSLAAQLAAKYLKDGGVLTLTGAQPALEGTSG